MLSRSGCLQLQRATLSAQASLKTDSAAPALQMKKLENGLVVAGLDTGAKLSSVGVVTKAGSRYEGYDNAGISHALRASFGLKSERFSGFGITRHIQQAGASVTAAGSRDYIMYSTQFVRGNHQEIILDYMFDAVASPKFRKWETSDAHAKVKIQTAELPGQVRAIENLHKAAYRNDGLANSVYCPEHMIGKHSDSALEAFHKKTVTAERSMLVGLNMDFGHLLDFAKSLDFESGTGPSVTDAKFFGGGDIRTDQTGGIAHIAIAADAGNPITNLKEAAANYILKSILGNGEIVKRGALGGKLAKSLGEGMNAVTGLHSTYVGASLIGAFISTDAASAGQTVSAVAAALRSVTVSAEEFSAAKKACAVEIGEMGLNPMMQIEMIAGAMETPDLTSFEAVANIIDQVSLADVQAAAKKLSNAKLSLGAYGNLANVPYADSL